MVNGSPTEEFRMTKGLRQGDPMAPFLFLIVAEGLSRLLDNAVDRNLFKQYTITRGDQHIQVSHIQYTDDTILIGEMSKENVWALMHFKEFRVGFRVKSELP